ncbi:zinc ribbon domain-containing protein [Lactobacillus sp. Sy-1]|uniref:zinc ribbon domain-containing protein n=1 Tax=Lactobacillus sp. Sy-1 TaxID=2109645 RepID=UPI001C5843B0|nr:zinc ribbon domain-containing protein [Lactobacillus sp. Sy-1]MBW1605024.1 zinc ribbon domain-containing protein [Lactobacillus sp. Sy-1]
MKTCPNCGRQVENNSKFCTYCGYKFIDPSNDSVVSNPENKQSQSQSRQQSNQHWDEKTKEAKRFSKNYFQWFKDTLKHPTALNDSSHKFFGLTSLIISLVLIALNIIQGFRAFVALGLRMAGGILGGATSGLDATSSLSTITGSSEYGNIVSSVFIHLFVYIVLALLITVLIPFAIRKAFYKDRISLWNFINQFASYSNYVLLIELLALIFFTLSVFVIFSSILLSIVSLGYLIAFLFSIFSTNERNGLDRIYAVLIGLFVETLLIMIISVGIAF